MKTKTHKVQIETELIASENNLNTYQLTKKLIGVKGEKATVILLCPTRNKDNIYAEDSTLTHLVSHMQELGINELRVINLFSQVVEGKMSAKGLTVDDENLDFINKIMEEPTFKDEKFIIAWGSSMSTSYAVNMTKAKVLSMFKKHFPRAKAYQIVTDNYDVNCEYAHPLFLGIRCKGYKWELEPVNITAKMLVMPEKKTNNIVEKESDFDYVIID